ncbi:hypothetical protein AURDEDRAFT_161753 [Auricularia subglabra TFB-10046 SS5]|nr:hypothetical protein AURDEDRAFT_161753 [Auricularia subglabra TFB-10046 SS5]
MLPFDQAHADPHLPPEPSVAFEAACSVMAAELTYRAAVSVDLKAAFKAMHEIFLRTTRAASRDWNRSHDRLRVLPVELQAICWSYLRQAEKVQLARVCSSWRDISRNTPSLWDTLKIRRTTEELPALFSRSAQLPLVISIPDKRFRDLAYVDDCLRTHFHRLRELRISSSEFHDREFEGCTGLFQYPAPALEHLSLGLLESGVSVIGPDLFDGYAPNLRSLALQEVPFPASCPAFRGITRLVVSGGGTIYHTEDRGLEHIFNVAPDLEVLELGSVADAKVLPRIPAQSKLSHMSCSLIAVSLLTLVDRGYMGLPVFNVSRAPRDILASAARHDIPSLTILCINYAGVASLIMRGENEATASFRIEDISSSTLRKMLSDDRNLHSIQRLVLPSSPRTTYVVNRTPRYPFIENQLQMPALRTLVISHCAAGRLSLFDADLPFGTIVAPLLSRVEITHGPQEGGVAEPIDPVRLAFFIEKHIVCNDPAALEVVVDTSNGNPLNLQDGDGIEWLRRFIGKLVIWYGVIFVWKWH